MVEVLGGWVVTDEGMFRLSDLKHANIEVDRYVGATPENAWVVKFHCNGDNEFTIWLNDHSEAVNVLRLVASPVTEKDVTEAKDWLESEANGN